MRSPSRLLRAMCRLPRSIRLRRLRPRWPCGEPEPVGAIVLIGLGLLFLFGTLGIFHFDWIGRGLAGDHHRRGHLDVHEADAGNPARRWAMNQLAAHPASSWPGVCAALRRHRAARPMARDRLRTQLASLPDPAGRLSAWRNAQPWHAGGGPVPPGTGPFHRQPLPRPAPPPIVPNVPGPTAGEGGLQ